MTLIKLRTKRFTVCDIVFVRKHIKTTFGRQWGYHTITGRLQIPTRASRQKFSFWFACVLSLDLQKTFAKVILTMQPYGRRMLVNFIAE